MTGDGGSNRLEPRAAAAAATEAAMDASVGRRYWRVYVCTSRSFSLFAGNLSHVQSRRARAIGTDSVPPRLGPDIGDGGVAGGQGPLLAPLLTALCLAFIIKSHDLFDYCHAFGFRMDCRSTGYTATLSRLDAPARALHPTVQVILSYVGHRLFRGRRVDDAQQLCVLDQKFA